MSFNQVTIIIPVYNVEKFVEKCMDSVVHQTYSNLQILVVNDGSKDASVEICKKYAQQDSRVRILEKENGGLSSARNYGLDYMEGDYCYFLDSDDYLELDAIERMLATMTIQASDLLVFGSDQFGISGNHWEDQKMENQVYEIENIQERIAFYSDIYYQYKIRFEVWNKLFRADIIRLHNLRFVDNYEIFAEDVCFVSYYLQHVGKVTSMDSVFHHYLVREDSIMGQANRMTKVQEFSKLITYIKDYMIQVHGQGSEMIRGYSVLGMQLMHDTYKRGTLHQVGKEVAALYEAGFGEYLREAAKDTLEQKKYVKKKYNQFEPHNRKLGTCLVEEAYLTYYGDQLLLRKLITVLIIMKRAVRWIKRKISKGGNHG